MVFKFLNPCAPQTFLYRTASTTPPSLDTGTARDRVGTELRRSVPGTELRRSVPGTELRRSVPSAGRDNAARSGHSLRRRSALASSLPMA